MDLHRIATRIAVPIDVETSPDEGTREVIRKSWVNYPVPVKFYNYGQQPKSLFSTYRNLRSGEPFEKSELLSSIESALKSLEQEISKLTERSDGPNASLISEYKSGIDILQKMKNDVNKASSNFLHYMQITGLNYEFQSKYPAGWIAHDFAHVMYDYRNGGSVRQLRFPMKSSGIKSLSLSDVTFSSPGEPCSVDCGAIIIDINKHQFKDAKALFMWATSVNSSFRSDPEEIILGDIAWSYVNPEIKKEFSSLNLESGSDQGQEPEHFQRNFDVFQSLMPYYLKHGAGKGLPGVIPRIIKFDEGSVAGVIKPGVNFNEFATSIDSYMNEVYEDLHESLKPEIVNRYLGKFAVI